MIVEPLAIDLFCGLGGWSEGLLAESYDVLRNSLVVPGRFAPDVLGTPGYIAPEVLATQNLGIKD